MGVAIAAKLLFYDAWISQCLFGAHARVIGKRQDKNGLFVKLMF